MQLISSKRKRRRKRDWRKKPKLGEKKKRIDCYVYPTFIEIFAN